MKCVKLYVCGYGFGISVKIFGVVVGVFGNVVMKVFKKGGYV